LLSMAWLEDIFGSSGNFVGELVMPTGA
jgi:hypothetical protein